jgi:hypothetical protein
VDPASTKGEREKRRDSNEKRFFEAGFSNAHNTSFLTGNI